jgi:hypothetical protein
MSQSRSGKLDPDLEGWLLFNQKGGSASFGAKMAQSLNKWRGSGLYEPNLLDPLVEQSVQIYKGSPEIIASLLI